MKEEREFDVAVIGAGPGGYVAAIRAAQSGKKTALIEKEPVFGGTCLNVGCIPSKTLISCARTLERCGHAEEYGVTISPPSFSYVAMQKRKKRVVEGIRSSLSRLIESNDIAVFRGTASFTEIDTVRVRGGEKEDDSFLLRAKKSIIATGSSPLDIPLFPCDGKRILDSTALLERTALPESIVIIGGGYIGCEFASLFATLGVEVTLVEALPSIIRTQGKGVSDHLTQAFLKKGITLKTGVAVTGIEEGPRGVRLLLANGEAVEGEIAAVAVGRTRRLEGLGLERIGLPFTPGGAPDGGIRVDERCMTEIPGIYAVGDVTQGPMLAHVASHQGYVAASHATGRPGRFSERAIPAVIFTDPEVAVVGFTPEEAEKGGRHISVGTYPFRALGKSIATGETEGFSQIVSDKETGEILGAQVVGHEASILISELTLAINNELTLDCLIDTIHAHPTVAEGWHEAALLATGFPLHFPKRT
ncbi:MAG: dihydrolipoyl dehydrogenase [Simkaniaceae bacterium]|nr:dihydrolipoyl dehydrogenase [Simkaniaceae bacterium]